MIRLLLYYWDYEDKTQTAWKQLDFRNLEDLKTKLEDLEDEAKERKIRQEMKNED